MPAEALITAAKHFVAFVVNFLQLGLSLCLFGSLLLAWWRVVARRGAAHGESPASLEPLRVAGSLSLGLGALLLVGGAMPGFIAPTVHRWESLYPSFDAPARCVALDGTSERRVVVLGSAANDAPGRSAVSRLSSQGVSRLAEGVGIYRSCGAKALLLTGDFSAQAAALAAQALGVPSSATRVVPGAITTAMEAAVLHPLLGAEPFILVSSALHLPRAMALFEERGMAPVAAPTAFLTATVDSGAPFLPHAHSYELWQHYLHERIGLLWGRLSGDLSASY